MSDHHARTAQVADEPYFEWGVVERIRDESPRLMPSIEPSEDAAQSYMNWIEVNNQILRQQAEAEEASNFRGGNQSWYTWFHGNRPRCYATYYVVRRRVEPWERVG